MKSNQDQPTQTKTKNKTQRTPTKFLQQAGPKIQIGNFSEASTNITHTINCESSKLARQLVLELSGTKVSAVDPRENNFSKLKTHPWYGLVVLDQELTEQDKHFIALYIQENSDTSVQEFKLKAHRVFIDDPHRPVNHALIQEILSLIAFTEETHE